MSSSPVATPAAPLEKQERFISRQLARVERRLRWLDGWTAILLFLTGVLTAILLLISADLCFELSAAVRRGILIALGVLALGYISGCLWLFGAWRINPYYAAHQLEKSLAHPHGSLINWLDLHDRELPPVIRLNLSMQAARDLRQVDMEQVCRSRRHWLLSLALVLVLIGWFVLFFKQSSRFGALLVRNLLPVAEQPLPSRTDLQLLEPATGNVIIPVNHSLTFRASVRGWVPPAQHPQAPHILYRYSQIDPYARLYLDPDRDNEWTITFLPDQVQNGFWYRLAAGDAQTPEYQVQVHSLPQVVRFDVTYHYRPYLGLPDRQEHYPNEQSVFPHVRDYRGTQVFLRAKTNCRLRNGLLTLVANGQSRQVPATIPEDAPDTLCFSWVLEHSGTFSLFFRDSTGESNGDRTAYLVDVLEDRAPVVVLHQPGRDVRLPVGGLLRLEGSATDDWGIKHLRLRLALVDNQQRQMLADKPYRQGKELRYADGKYPDRVTYKDFLVLDRLATVEGQPLTLRPGQTLEYWLEAVDACDYPPPGGNVGRSQKYKVLLEPPGPDAGKRQQEQAQAQREQQAHERQQDQELAQPKLTTQSGQSAEEKKEPSASPAKSSGKGQSADGPPTPQPQGGKGQSSQEPSQRPDQGTASPKNQPANAGQSAGNNLQGSSNNTGQTSNSTAPGAKEGQSATTRPPDAGKSETGQSSPTAGGTLKDSQQPAEGQGAASSKSGNGQQTESTAAAPPLSSAQRLDFERKVQQLEQVLRQQGTQNSHPQSGTAPSSGPASSTNQASSGQAPAAKEKPSSTTAGQVPNSTAQNEQSNSPTANGDKKSPKDNHKTSPNQAGTGQSAGQPSDPSTAVSGKAPNNPGTANNSAGSAPASPANPVVKNSSGSSQPNQTENSSKSANSSASKAANSPSKGSSAGNGAANGSSSSREKATANATTGGVPGQSTSNASGSTGQAGDRSTTGNSTGKGSSQASSSSQKSENANSAANTSGASGNAVGKSAGNTGESATGKSSTGTAATGSSGQDQNKSAAGSSGKSADNSLSQSKETTGSGQRSGNASSAGQKSGNADGVSQKSAANGSAAASGQSPGGSSAKDSASRGQTAGPEKGSTGRADAPQSSASAGNAGKGDRTGTPPQQGPSSSSTGTGGGRFQDEAVHGSRSDPDLARRLGNLQLEDLQKKLTPDVLKKLNWTEKEREEFLRQAQAYERWLAQQKRQADADKRQGQGSQLPAEGVRRVAPGSRPLTQPLDSRHVPPPPEFREAYRRFSSQPEGLRPEN